MRNVWLPVLARVGLVAQGVSFALVGVLALELALGHGGKSTSREGALATIAQHGWGKLLLILLAAGFAAYALWRVAEAIFERDENDPKLWAKRAAYLGRAVIYAGLTYGAIKIATGPANEPSQTERAHKATAQILSWPAGTWLVGLAGACIVGAGIFNAYRGITRSFLDDWNSSNMTDAVRRWATRIGVVGLFARFVVFTLIGAFAIKAAIDYAPKESIGLDGALRKLTDQPYGPRLLGITAAGLIAYAVFCFAEARYLRI